MKLTVREIARLAGVSPATVSRALNGQQGMSEATRRRVCRILEDHPENRRGRRKQKSGNIGLLFLQKPLYPWNFFEKVNIFLRTFGPEWKLFLFPPTLSASRLELYRSRNEIDGLLIYGFSRAGEELETVLEKIPHVWISSRIRENGHTDILMGNELAGRLAARYLIQKGCRNPGCLEIPCANPGVAARCEGFRFEFFARKLPCQVVSLKMPYLENTGFDELEKYFSEFVRQNLLSGMDGLFCPESYPAPALYLALHRFASDAPFPHVVFGNHSPEYLSGLNPPAASVDLGDEVLAEYACRELFRLIHEDRVPDERSRIFVNPRLVLPRCDS